MNNETNNLRIKKFLRTQVEWYTQGSIDENNLRFKIDDCRETYPEFDYELELGLITMELRVKLLGLKLLETN